MTINNLGHETKCQRRSNISRHSPSSFLILLFLLILPSSLSLYPPSSHLTFHHRGSETTTKRNNKISDKKRLITTTTTTTRGGETTTTTDSSSGATIASSIFNLVNNVAGAGILTLAAGKAKGTGWIPSLLLCAILGAISAHTFMIIGKACEMSGEKDFKGLWARTIGPSTTYMVDSLIAILCIACAIIYSGILGDVFTPLLASAGLPPHLNSRTTNILILTISVLLPLGLVENLSALAFTSVLGFSAIMYTVVFIVYRSLDGTYDVSKAGRFVTDASAIASMPSFTKSTMWNFDFSSLVLASNLGLAYIAHYNAPIFYRELKNASAPRFNLMVSISFALLTLLYIVTMVAGYATFGDVCEGNILLNYHAGDLLSTLGRVATGFSILFGFPLVLCGAREAIVGVGSSFGKDWGKDKAARVRLVMGILALVTIVSVMVDDVSLVVGLTGAVMGSFIVYICPGLIRAKMGNGGEWNLIFVPFGLFIGGLGVYMTLKEAGIFS